MIKFRDSEVLPETAAPAVCSFGDVRTDRSRGTDGAVADGRHRAHTLTKRPERYYSIAVGDDRQ